MRHILIGTALLLAIATAACAHIEQPAQLTGSDEGTVACKSESASVALLRASPPSLPTNDKVLNAFVARGDCLVMPAGWQILVAEDPLLDQQEQHASKWTTRTPHGIVHM
ncbi:hypothetical protein [Dyella acidiphila]|uniref:Uncharacterized protein n=1 Tax=Dyella acidiphila TaxID=2775866 RepID=A0ABR9G4Z2_9GAMM|nr:hypothetical protein [Dyella acidiphila]MBE1159106.1 hypothetical protein [Dyella acidiphila]